MVGVAQWYPPERTELKSFVYVRYGRGASTKYMYTAYVLQDDHGKLYKGLTNNLERRLREHKSGHTITTSRMSGLKVVYQEIFQTFIEARSREKYFKTAAGRKFLKDKV